jgi:hypothetical protein
MIREDLTNCIIAAASTRDLASRITFLGREQGMKKIRMRLFMACRFNVSDVVLVSIKNGSAYL